MEIDEDVKKEIEHVARVITDNLKVNSTVFMNIQIEEEYS